MTSRTPNWRSRDGLAVGKGATIQEFAATVGDKSLEIEVAPWGEGRLKVNGRQVASVTDAKDRRQAFRKLATTAEHYLQESVLEPECGKSAPVITAVKAELPEGKKGLRAFTIVASVIFGVVALLQALRILFDWPAEIGGWSVPMWLSWIIVVVAGSLSYSGIRLSRTRR